MQLQAMAARPPAAWTQYWDMGEYNKEDRRTLLISQLVTFFNSMDGHRFLREVQLCHDTYRYVLPLNYANLMGQAKIKDLEVALETAPGHALACLSVAASEVRCAVGGIVCGAVSPHCAADCCGCWLVGMPQALFHSPQARQLLGVRQPGPVAVRLSHHKDSEIAIRKLKSSSIGGWPSLGHHTHAPQTKK